MISIPVGLPDDESIGWSGKLAVRMCADGAGEASGGIELVADWVGGNSGLGLMCSKQTSTCSLSSRSIGHSLFDRTCIYINTYTYMHI